MQGNRENYAAPMTALVVIEGRRLRAQVSLGRPENFISRNLLPEGTVTVEPGETGSEENNNNPYARAQTVLIVEANGEEEKVRFFIDTFSLGRVILGRTWREGQTAKRLGNPPPRADDDVPARPRAPLADRSVNIDVGHQRGYAYAARSRAVQIVDLVSDDSDEESVQVPPARPVEIIDIADEPEDEAAGQRTPRHQEQPEVEELYPGFAYIVPSPRLRRMAERRAKRIQRLLRH